MIEWEDESVATQDKLTKRLIDTVAAVVLVVIVVAGLFLPDEPDDLLKNPHRSGHAGFYWLNCSRIGIK